MIQSRIEEQDNKFYGSGTSTYYDNDGLSYHVMLNFSKQRVFQLSRSGDIYKIGANRNTVYIFGVRTDKSEWDIEELVQYGKKGRYRLNISKGQLNTLIHADTTIGRYGLHINCTLVGFPKEDVGDLDSIESFLLFLEPYRDRIKRYTKIQYFL